MTPKQQALYALMENAGYSIGCIHTAIALLGQSREALDDTNPTRQNGLASQGVAGG